MKNKLNKYKTYYGAETKKALINFQISRLTIDSEFIQSLLLVKKASCLTNLRINKVSKEKAKRIIRTIDVLLDKKSDFNALFPLDPIQGGAGTSINMNANEVIASYASVDALDDVNMSQSTNDVLPTTLRITIYKLLSDKLLSSLNKIAQSFDKKSKEFSSIKKLARTHLQDAVPMSLGEEFGAYASIVKQDINIIKKILPELLKINLGGTAIGNSINAGKNYKRIVVKELSTITDLDLKSNDNLIASTQSQSIFVSVSGLLNTLASDLSKIASDLRLLTSGPNGGISEIELPGLQAGSTIMAGKVNPVIPELLNQVCFQVMGSNVTITMAAMNAQLELGVMFPIIAFNLIQSINWLINCINIFNDKCIKGIKPNIENCRKNLNSSTAYATLLIPYLGYQKTTEIVKESLEANKTIEEIVISKKLLLKKKFDNIINSI